jgi:hypothetical protein
MRACQLIAASRVGIAEYRRARYARCGTPTLF